MAKTNNLGNVAVSNAGYKRSKLPLTHNVNTTLGWCETQPLVNRLCVPDTKNVIEIESLCRLSPIVVPTFGDCSVNFYHYFVNCSDLLQHFNDLLSETPVSGAYGNEFMMESVPSMPHCLISLLPFFGAHLTIYRSRFRSVRDSKTVSFFGNSALARDGESVTEATTWIANLVRDINTYNDFSTSMLYSMATDFFGPSRTCYHIDARILIGDDAVYKDTAGVDISSQAFKIPLSNTSIVDFIYQQDSEGVLKTSRDGIDIRPVTYNDADYVSEFKFSPGEGEDEVCVTFCFRFSAFGKRIKKILNGSGYKINLSITKKRSLLPLFAYYKAYYEIFGLRLYENWENKAACKLLRLCDDFGISNYTVGLSTSLSVTGDLNKAVQSLFKKFILDLGSCWFTDSQDWVSSHTVTDGVDVPVGQEFLATFHDGFDESAPALDTAADHVNSGVDTSVQGATFFGQSAHSFINNIVHGYVDSELLKRLYVWTNKDTIAGRIVAERCRLQGLGTFMERCKPRFIGFDSLDIQFSDVVSQADTFKDGQGSLLGEYGGKGIGYTKATKHYYHNDEFGFLITIAVMVPHAGYCQATDPSIDCCGKYDFYQPAFDALGKEVTPKEYVFSEVNSSFEGDLHDLERGFGYTTRYSKFKIINNVMNGDFNRPETSERYQRYMLDKIMDIGKVTNDPVQEISSTQEGVIAMSAFAHRYSLPSDFPVAGNIWLYLGRYSWMSNFERIFADNGDDLGQYRFNSLVVPTDNRAFWEFFNTIRDGFLLHNVVHYTQFAPVIPFSDSFETLDDGNRGKIDTNIQKA